MNEINYILTKEPAKIAVVVILTYTSIVCNQSGNYAAAADLIKQRKQVLFNGGISLKDVGNAMVQFSTDVKSEDKYTAFGFCDIIPYDIMKQMCDIVGPLWAN